MNEIEKEKKGFRWGYAVFAVFLLMFLGFLAAGFLSLFLGDVSLDSGNVAVIPIEGIITGLSEESFFDSTLSSLEIIKLIEEADENPSIKAIVLQINTPGGSAVASEEIADAVSKVNKTTVAWIREVGASGGYWIASSTDYIVANRASITGSIGVIASYLEVGGLLERYNVTYQRLVSGKYKDMGSPFRELTSEEEKIFQETLDEIRIYFVEEVAKSRNMSKKEIDKVANGLFYTGSQAKALGLVDELGGKDEVIAYIEKKEQIEVEFVEYKKEKGLLDLLSDVATKQSFAVGNGIGNAISSKRQQVSIMT